ncbi:MAG: zinc ABC transporter substrate-binding protein [Sedimentisphaerales bacterium]|nr:zinc ABC transporter substrate-binding protein [Sedimentisphaerales bacterium]MBN2844219.1 zinc ABC transporter substrate-binding protein [Sedimentisphaerales bacterium]
MSFWKFILLSIFFLASPALTLVYAYEAENRLLIIASTTQVADFARVITGDRCEVRCVLAPGADPHTYEPTPDDIALVMKADLCLQNGLGLEGKNWMSNLAKGAGKKVIVCTDGIEPLATAAEGQQIADPHAWFSPANAAAYVNNITREILTLDPSGKDYYLARSSFYLDQLRLLDSWIKEQVNLILPDKRVLVTGHDAFNYFCREYRFNPANNYMSLAPVGWSTGSEVGAGMTPQRRKQVVDGLKKAGARAVFVETSINPKLIREIAAQAGIVVGGELYSDSMGDAGTDAQSYIGMMQANVLTIVEALR